MLTFAIAILVTSPHQRFQQKHYLTFGSKCDSSPSIIEEEVIAELLRQLSCCWHASAMGNPIFEPPEPLVQKGQFPLREAPCLSIGY
jgi:hypothetical protein